MDIYWKVSRSTSVILEGYKDEIATSKHKPSRNVIHGHKWLPYGERISEDNQREAYGMLMLRLISRLLAKCGDQPTNGYMDKVCSTNANLIDMRVPTPHLSGKEKSCCII